MIRPEDWIAVGRGLVLGSARESSPGLAQAVIRRGVSSAYYGLFHALTTASSDAFSGGGPALCHQVQRAFNHAAMRKLCEAYVKSPERPFRPALHHLNAPAPDWRLIELARAFTQLQEGRYAADYDIGNEFPLDQAITLVFMAQASVNTLTAIQSFPATRIFLTALLLADRWTRHG